MNIYIFIDTHHHHDLTTSAWRKVKYGKPDGGWIIWNIQDLKCIRLPTNIHCDKIDYPMHDPSSWRQCPRVYVYDASPTQAALEGKQSVSGALGTGNFWIWIFRRDLTFVALKHDGDDESATNRKLCANTHKRLQEMSDIVSRTCISVYLNCEFFINCIII